jgi:hypothetical protein
MATAIFGGTTIETTSGPSIASTRVASVSREAQRISAQRRAHEAGIRRTSGLAWTAPRNGRLDDLIVLTRRSCVNHAGVFIGDSIEAHILQPGLVRNRREWRQLIDGARERLSQARSAAVEHRLAQELDVLRAPIVRRMLAISVDTTDRAEQQSSLFDHRAETDAMARADAAARRQRALSWTLQAVASPLPALARAEVIAVWPVKRQ